jgi:hypothetical protein
MNQLESIDGKLYEIESHTSSLSSDIDDVVQAIKTLVEPFVSLQVEHNIQRSGDTIHQFALGF